jgi:hypothetical protein
MRHPVSRSPFPFMPALCLALAVACRVAPAGAYFEETFEQRFFIDEGHRLTDHTILHVPGDGFHIFYCVGIVEEDYNDPDNMNDIGHARSDDLIHWTIEPRILPTVPDTWKERNLWAPQLVEHPVHGYLLYYTGVDSMMAQATAIARSTDLYTWEDLTVDAPAYHPDSVWAGWRPGQWSDGRDPFVWEVDVGYLMVNTAKAAPHYTGVDTLGAVSLAESTDGLQWHDVGMPLFMTTSKQTLESVSIYRRPDRYFMFYTPTGNQPEGGGVRYMTSENLFTGWNRDEERILSYPVGIGPGEVFDGGQGSTLLTRVIDVYLDGVWYNGGAKIDTLYWGSNSVSFATENRLFDQWYIAAGNAFAHQPTFGDLPYVRGNPRSEHEGYFWINSAETYDGPLGNQDHNEPPHYEATGILRSRNFVVTGGHIDLRVAGGNDPDDLYVGLVRVSDGAVLRRSTGADSNVLYLRHWDLTGLQGETVRIEVVDMRIDSPHGFIAVDEIREGPGQGVGVADAGAPGTPALRLGPPFPNPLRIGAATVPVELDGARRVRLAIYDVQGRLLDLLHDGPLTGGHHQLYWSGHDARGRRHAPGTYFLRLESDGTVTARKLVLER